MTRVVRAVVLVVVSAASVGFAQSARALLDQASADFQRGRIAESVAAFDRLVALDPASAPYLWQRGIALYYAGRFDDCRRQFESHRTVNPDDVENAAWHFLCVARWQSRAEALKRLLPVGPDSRVPMREIYQMFQGRLNEAQVMAAAGTDLTAIFYANLYTGLYLEVTGSRRGRQRIQAAAEPRFARVGGYMHDVARVHSGLP